MPADPAEWSRPIACDDRGTVGIIVAGAIAMLGGVAAYAVDLGSVNLAKRRAQQAADLAAMAGASRIAEARSAAIRALKDNQAASAENVAVETGLYEADPTRGIAARFRPGPMATANAVRVAFDTTTPIYFGKLLRTGPAASIRVEATAMVARDAAFAIGSRLLSLEGGVLNGLLTALTGSSVSLTAMDYNALASGQVSLFRMLDALSAEVGLEAGTYQDVLRSNVSTAQIARAARSGTTDARASAALQLLVGQVAAASAAINLERFIDLGPYRYRTIGEAPAFDVAVSAMDLVMTHLQVANGSRFIDAGLGLDLPGLASARLMLLVGERPQGRPWLRLGHEGASVHTAQTRLLLDVRVLGTGLLSAAEIRLPIYLELASGDATLRRVSCGARRDDMQVTVDARSGVVDAWIGDVSAMLMKNVSKPVSADKATIVRLPLVRLNGRAHVTVRNDRYTPLSFSRSDIDAKRAKTVTTSSFTTSLTQNLLRDLTLEPEVVGLSLLDLGGVNNAAAALLGTVTPSVDKVLFTLLNTLGIGLGQADVWVYAARCDGAALVQ